MKIIEKPKPEEVEIEFVRGKLYRRRIAVGSNYYLCANISNAYKDPPKLILINVTDGKRWGDRLPARSKGWEEVEAELHIL